MALLAALRTRSAVNRRRWVGRVRSDGLELSLNGIIAVAVVAQIGFQILGVAPVGIAQRLEGVVDLIAQVEVDARYQDGGVVGKVIHRKERLDNVGKKRPTGITENNNATKERDGRRETKKIEIGLFAEINLAAQYARGAHQCHDNGGESYINHHFSFLSYQYD